MHPALCLAALILIALGIGQGNAHDTSDAPSGVSREILAKEPLPEIQGYIVTALTVEFEPGAVVGPHRHGGLVYVYLLEGHLRSHLEGEDPKDYVAGQSWIEPAGALHSRTENLSPTKPARFLAVIYSKEDAVITQPVRP